MMAPYAVGHLKMSFLLEELGYKLQKDDRFKLYLTNTLEMEELAQTELPGMASLSEESHLAGKVKKEQLILAILGNPPYSKSSANKSDFIDVEMNLYKEDVRTEKNIQPLSDDYIKFIRFAHWKIDKSGIGVIGMITNNSYLSGVIHRGMRKKLLDSFNEIYVLNLHGNSRVGEKCPDGSPDENVFDIQQGVSLALFVKSSRDLKLRQVFYQDIWGLRESKYNYLEKSNIKLTKWVKLQPSEPYYFFVKKDFSLQTDYDEFLSIPEIFNISSSGVKTHRDHFIVGFMPEEIKQRMHTFISDLPDDLVKQALNLRDTRDWKIKTARENTKKIDWKRYIMPYSYRPFDSRHICYLPNLIDRGGDRWDLMRNFFDDNIGLMVDRTTSDRVPYSHVFVSDTLMDVRTLPDYGGAPFLFPLYLYPSVEKMSLFRSKDAGEKYPNIIPNLFKLLLECYKKNVSPEEIFYYIYAVLYSNVYRTKYAEFLKIDFPRVPFTKDYGVFSKVARLGKRLVDLHLLKSPELDLPIAKFQGKGEDKVEKVRYEPLGAGHDLPRIYINKEQYFEGVQKEVWEYQIGGYQVSEKWLKERKGRKLSLDDIKHYCKVVTAIQKTIEIQSLIDGIYPEVEKVIMELKKGGIES